MYNRKYSEVKNLSEKLGKRISVRELVGRGYGKFWNFKGRYRVAKGSRGSKKSCTVALWFIIFMMRYPTANLLVVRMTFRTLKDSCFAQLRWAIRHLEVDEYWEVRKSPLELEYKPTGQKIYFRGLDDPLKITSITVDVGSLCWLWIEEAYELKDETSFSTLEESIRGEVAEGLFKQITITFNPWDASHWLKARFFDVTDSNILAITTNYMCNEWLDEADHAMFESMRINNPRRYEVAGLGNWGMPDGNLFERDWMNARYRLLPTGAQIIQTWDLPFKASEASAKCAGLVMARKGSEIFIIDCINEKMDFVTSVAAIKNMTAKHPEARAKIIEDKANGPAIMNFLKKDVSGMIAFNPKGSKEDRALSVAPYFEAGNVYFPENAPWVQDLVDDLVKFPSGTYKDTVDALVQGILYLMDVPRLQLGNLNSNNQGSYWNK